jgi:hypothetical protein
VINECLFTPAKNSRVALDGTAIDEGDVSKRRKQSKKNIDKETRDFLENILYWEFDHKEDSTSCPEPSRELPYDYQAKQEKHSLQTIEAEEISHTGTISWMMLLRDNSVSQKNS